MEIVRTFCPLDGQPISALILSLEEAAAMKARRPFSEEFLQLLDELGSEPPRTGSARRDARPLSPR